MPHYGLEALGILTNKHKFLNCSLRSVWFSCWEKDRKRVRWHIYCGTKCIAVYNTSSWTHILPLSSLAANIVLWRSRPCSYFRTNVCINKQTNKPTKQITYVVLNSVEMGGFFRSFVKKKKHFFTAYLFQTLGSLLTCCVKNHVHYHVLYEIIGRPPFLCPPQVL